MEKKELSTEEKAMLLYEAMKPTLDFDGGEEWQNKRNENSDLITVRKILPHKQA